MRMNEQEIVIELDKDSQEAGVKIVSDKIEPQPSEQQAPNIQQLLVNSGFRDSSSKRCGSLIHESNIQQEDPKNLKK